ncbi:MAG TPA: DUF488 family protein [Polyangiaceae bacterium]|jgi:uncharacterized protein YeaO (DUF488 family)|nr:DUF488 family protein [Polyangiaceae bacterium]
MKERIRLKRAYEPPEPDDGYRVLVERLWPRGVRKTTALLDGWAKDVAPSTGLRKWFDHDPERWLEFSRRYRRELREEPAASAVRELVLRARSTLTLVYGARDEEHNAAVVLRSVLTRVTTRRATSSRGPARVRKTATSGRGSRK